MPTHNILLDEETTEFLKQESKEQNRSFRGHIKFILEEYVKHKNNTEEQFTQPNNSTQNSTQNSSHNVIQLKNNVPNNSPKF